MKKKSLARVILSAVLHGIAWAVEAILSHVVLPAIAWMAKKDRWFKLITTCLGLSLIGLIGCLGYYIITDPGKGIAMFGFTVILIVGIIGTGQNIEP